MDANLIIFSFFRLRPTDWGSAVEGRRRNGEEPGEIRGRGRIDAFFMVRGGWEGSSSREEVKEGVEGRL